MVPGAVTFQETVPSTVTDVTWRNVSSAARLPDVSGLAGLTNYWLSHDNAAIALGPLSVSGNLTVTAFGPITQAAGLGNGITAATASFEVLGNNPITLTNADNDIGSVGFSARHGTQTVSFVNKDGFSLSTSDLGRSALSVEAKTGDIDQDLPITQLPAAGDVTLTVAAGAKVTLDEANTFGGRVVIQGQASEAYIRNFSPTASLDDYVLPNSLTKLTVHHQIAPVVLGNMGTGGVLPNLATLDVDAEGIYQKPGTAIKVATASFGNLEAPPPTAEFKLTAAGNDFGTVRITHLGYGDVAITDANALSLGTTSLGQGRASIRAGGAITQTGPLTTGGARLSVASTGGAITLDNAGNDILGVLDLSAAGAAPVTVVNDTDLNLGNVTTGTGALTVSTTAGFPNGTISQAPGTRIQAGGAFTVGGPDPFGSDVRLDNPGNTFAGPVSVPHATNLFLRAAGSLTLGDWQAGTAIVLTGGAITQQAGTAIVQGEAGGNFYADAGGSPITLDSAGNRFYVFSAATTGNLSVRDTNGLILGDLRLGGGNLTVQVGDALGEIGSILQTGPGTVSVIGAGGTQVTLDKANELRGTVSVTGAGAVEVWTRNDLPLTAGSLAGATTVKLRAGGTITLPDAALNLQSLDAAASRIKVSKDVTASGALALAGDTDFGAGPRVLTGNSVSLTGDATDLVLTAFLDDGAKAPGVGSVKAAGFLSQSALTAPNGFGAITVGREMNLSTVLANGAGRVAGIKAGAVSESDVVAESVGPVSAVGYAAVPFQTGLVGKLQGLRVYARGADPRTGVGIGPVAAEGDIKGTRLLAPKGVQSVAAGGEVNDFDAVADFIPDGSAAKPTYGRVASLSATSLDNARVRADTIGTVTTGTSAKFRTDGSVRESQFVARDGTGTGIAAIRAAGNGSEVEVWAPGKVPEVSFAGGLSTYSVIGAGYGPTGSLGTLRLGGFNFSTVVSRQVTSITVNGRVEDSFVNVFGNDRGVGLGSFAATGTVAGSVFDITDGDLTSFSAARFWNSTAQVGARFTRGNTVDAAVLFNTLRKLGSFRVTNPSDGTAAGAAFRDSYVAAGNLGTVSITQVATVDPDTELQGVVHSTAGSAGTVTVAGTAVPVGTTIQAKFKNAAN